MNSIDAILLGVLQGLTEFLPISSSAHLIAGQAVLGVSPPGATLEVALHAGTMLAILIVLRREMLAVAKDGLLGGLAVVRGRSSEDMGTEAPLFPVALAVAIGTVPAVIAGFLLGGAIEAVFESVTAGGLFLCVTGLLLVSSRFAPAGHVSRVGPLRGLLIGVAQACALLPGISRSGATIVAGRWLGVEGAAAARFSFLLAVPAIAGAAAYELATGGPAQSAGGVPLACGVLASALSGAVGLILLLRIVRGGRLYWFAAYCLPAGLAMVILGMRG